MKVRRLNLKDLLSVSPEDTFVRFMEQRVLVFDALALGLLRKELIDTIGREGARKVLTRFGYAHGWRTAKMLLADFPELVAEGHGGEHLHRLFGLVNTTELRPGSGRGGEPLIESTLAGSYEAEQHLHHFGKAEEPICWTLSGFASGYESCKHGREVYFIEDCCCAAGAATCHIVGRFKEEWGDEIVPHLAYYESASADFLLSRLSADVNEMEKRIRRQRRLLGMLGDGTDAYPGFIVRSEAMRQVMGLAKRVAQVDSTVLVSGPSGVGKERVSQYIHNESHRAHRPFVAVNCASLTETLLEAELFGHAKGAFTGAHRQRPGLFEEANGGTILLDEVGETSPAMQVKLLRVLQEREVKRVGENSARPIDVRVLAATNRDLSLEVEARRFRKDLYYRLRVIELDIPALRDRSEDILPLANIFLRQVSSQMNRDSPGLTAKAGALLLDYSWPGNVRELQNAMERAAALCGGAWVAPEDLPPEIRSAPPSPRTRDGLRPLRQVEKSYILDTLSACGNDKRVAARSLGLSLSTLYRKLSDYEGEGEGS